MISFNLTKLRIMWTQVTKDIGDAIESLEYEINTLYTSNGQTPFVTLGFGLGTDQLSRKFNKQFYIPVLKVSVKIGSLQFSLNLYFR